MSKMTAADISVAIDDLCKAMGPKSEVSVIFHRHRQIFLGAYAHGMTQSITFSIMGPDLDEVFTEARAKWTEVKEKTFAKTIELMALEIIRVTAIKGSCQGCDLRTAAFAPEDIDHIGPLACAKANEMASNGPFTIAPEAQANAA